MCKTAVLFFQNIIHCPVVFHGFYFAHLVLFLDIWSYFSSEGLDEENQISWCWLIKRQWIILAWASIVAQMVKKKKKKKKKICLQCERHKTWIWSLGWEDPVQKRMAIYSSILAWEILWIEEPVELQSMGSQRLGHDWVTSTHTLPNFK